MCSTLSALALDAYESLNDAMPMISEQANSKRLDKLPTIGRVNHPVEEAQRFASDWSKEYVQNGAFSKMHHL